MDSAGNKPVRHDLDLVNGFAFELTLQVFDVDEVTPFDLDGWTFVAWAASKPDDLGGDRVELAVAAGADHERVVTVSAVNAGIIKNRWVYQVEVTPPSSTPRPFLSGEVSVAGSGAGGECVAASGVLTFSMGATVTFLGYAAGATGPTGPGVATGGTTGQILAKASGDDFDTEWTDPVGAASDTEAGIVELATIGEVDTGTDATRAVTPAGLAGSALAASVAALEDDPTTQTLLDAEATTRGNADTALSGRLDTLEADPTTQTLLDAEATTRGNADTALSGRLDTLETDPTTKTYVDDEIAAAIVSAMTYKGDYNASSNSPDLDTSPSGIEVGDVYTVSTAGTFFAVGVEVGDQLVAKQDDPTLVGHWSIVSRDYTDSSIKVAYENNADTNVFDDAAVAAVIANTAKVTNATHTGEVTGSGALTIATPGTVTVATGDLVIVKDVSNANATAAVTASSIAALVSATSGQIVYGTGTAITSSSPHQLTANNVRVAAAAATLSGTYSGVAWSAGGTASGNYSSVTNCLTGGSSATGNGAHAAGGGYWNNAVASGTVSFAHGGGTASGVGAIILGSNAGTVSGTQSGVLMSDGAPSVSGLQSGFLFCSSNQTITGDQSFALGYSGTVATGLLTLSSGVSAIIASNTGNSGTLTMSGGTKQAFIASGTQLGSSSITSGVAGVIIASDGGATVSGQQAVVMAGHGSATQNLSFAICGGDATLSIGTFAHGNGNKGYGPGWLAAPGVGFRGKAPVAGMYLSADATDLASAIALVNDIKNNCLIAQGLAA